ncbi:MAG: 2-oxoacid:acceptor oxidoreductase family protein [Halodesulfurarchaeum sp.]
MSVASLDMTQIRWHSRGGQGGMTASQLLAEATFKAGKESTAFTFFGAERRGAPVTSFNRVSDTPVKLYSQVAHPDLVVVLDESLVDLEDVTAGLADDGTLVMNTTETDLVDFAGQTFVVDATTIALDYDLQADGTPIVNTPMLGAVAKTGLVDVDVMASVIDDAFGEANAEAARTAYEQAREV